MSAPAVRERPILRIGDIVRARPGVRAIVYGVRVGGGGRLLALLWECRPGGGRYGLTKRGAFAPGVIATDLESVAPCWASIAAEADAAALRAKKPEARAVYRRIAGRARRNEARLRALAERVA